MKNRENMGFLYLAEQVSPEDYKISDLKVVDTPNIFYVEFDTVLHTFLVMNRNGRQYLSKNISDRIMDERIQAYLADGGWFGEMNHPNSEYTGMKLSPERIQDIKMDNTSHKILNPVVTTDRLTSRIQTDSGTDAGINMAKKIIQGLIPCFSCRAIAGLELLNGRPTVNVRKLITYDWVLYPSHKEAKAISTPKFINKAVACVTEKVNEYARDVMIPLTEIFEKVGRSDVNTQIIMESFGLDVNDMQGFTPDRKQIIMKDQNNTIYCNMDITTRNTVNDYLSSF